ncbi:S24 family peptidase [Treponema socranskii]|uniref:S24 family peptidase n=1 Tax=Treponema socranskii TaxID=53419 RepID=UPI003D8D03E1
MINGLKERFASVRQDFGLNVKQFAESLDMEPTTVSSIEAGKREPSKEVLYNLAVKYAISLNWIFTGEGEKSLPKSLVPEMVLRETFGNGAFRIPVLDQSLSAGKGQFLPDNDVSTGYIAVPKELKRYGNNLTALYVNGDSMEPTLQRGDLIVCDSCGWDGEGIYALRMDGCGYVKRLARKPGKIVVISDNPKYQAWEEPAESQAIDIIGRVHYTFKHVD